MSAQVTIGNKETPEKGAVLQLKNINGVTDGSANATKGLMLPRVRLSSKTNLFPFFSKNPTEDSEATIIPTEEYDNQTKKSFLDKEHTGLIVYNTTNEILNFCEGVYIWDGSEWTAIKQNENENENETSNTLTDRDGNIYRIGTFGSAGTWMLEDLRTRTTSCGNNLTLLTIQEINESTRAWNEPAIAYPEDNIEYANKYGMYYSWAAATNGRGGFNGVWNYPEDEVLFNGVANAFIGTDHETPQGICPKGWHLPSDYEWTALFKYVHDNYKEYTIESLLPENQDYTIAWSNEWTIGFSEDYKGYLGIFMKSPTLVDGSLRNKTNGASKLDIDGGFNIYLTTNSMTSDPWGGIATYWTSSQGTDPYGSTGFLFSWVHSNQGVRKSSYARRRQMPVRCMKNSI